MPMSLAPRVRNAVRSFIWKRWWNAKANSATEKFWFRLYKRYA